MIKFSKKPIVVQELKSRAKKVGDNDDVPFCTLCISLTIENDVLDLIHQDMRRMLFSEKPPNDASLEFFPELNLSNNKFNYPRFVHLKPIGWNYHGEGYKMEFHGELKSSKKILIEGCAIDGIKIQPLKGAMVSMVFNVHVQSDGRLLERVGRMMGRTVTCSLIPPQIDDNRQEDIDDE